MSGFKFYNLELRDFFVAGLFTLNICEIYLFFLSLAKVQGWGDIFLPRVIWIFMASLVAVPHRHMGHRKPTKNTCTCFVEWQCKTKWFFLNLIQSVNQTFPSPGLFDFIVLILFHILYNFIYLLHSSWPYRIVSR